LILWGGWLLTTAIFFSVAGFFHEYYLSTMAPPLAALVGIGAIGLWQMRQQRPWLAFSLLLLGAGATLAFQFYSAQSYTSNTWWLPLTLLLFAAGVFLLAFDTIRRTPYLASGAFTCLVAAMLLTPGIWSGLTTFSTSNQTLPAAYGGQSFQGGFPGNFNMPGGNEQNGLQVYQALLDYLQQNTQGMKYLMAVPSSHDGDGYILATGRPVLLMGGFSGSDPVVSGTDLANLVSEGQLRYVMLGGGMTGNQNSSVSAWVTSTCQVVPGFETATRNMGAPDGTSAGQSSGFMQAFGGMQVSLYDCGG
jgi:4-amino-4-deoxy-L-arabinose transferase-like glycosyltransferase